MIYLTYDAQKTNPTFTLTHSDTRPQARVEGTKRWHYDDIVAALTAWQTLRASAGLSGVPIKKHFGDDLVLSEYPMLETEDGATLANTPRDASFFDVQLNYYHEESGEIEQLIEFENMTQEQSCELYSAIENTFTQAGLEGPGEQ